MLINPKPIADRLPPAGSLVLTGLSLRWGILSRPASFGSSILRRCLPAIVLALAGIGPARAGPLLDYLRAYDLNDYALGLSVSGSESPYADGDNSAFAYPYLTSFRDSAFTDDWFLISEGNLGFRWVNDAGWELGIVGRLQTLGLGNSDASALRGLDDRNWSIELAPMIGFRGWPVHVNFKPYREVLGRHGGTVSQLSLSLPREFDRGYLVPSVEGIWRSDDYTSYYFGVSPGEARPQRPGYQPGASLSHAIRLRWGYALTDNWLLSGSAGLEFLADEISASPIVDKDRAWSASLSLAYNSDLFQPRDADLGNKRQPRLEFRVSAFAASADSHVRVNADDGNAGDDLDLEDLLGISDSETVYQFDVIYRLNAFHRFELGYHEMSRAGAITLNREVRVGDSTFSGGTELATTFNSESLRLAYGYSLMNDAQKELGVMAGIHMNSSVTDILAVVTGQRERSDVSTPLPVAGLFGSVETGLNASLAARAQVFAMEFDRLEGYMIYLNIEWQRRFGDGFSAGISYQFYGTDLESTDADAQGSLRLRQHGPAIFFSANF